MYCKKTDIDYFLATLKVLVNVLLAVFWLVTATVTLYRVPETNVPVEISLEAIVDFTFLLSSTVPAGSVFVVISMLIPVVGILELKITLKE